MNFHVLINPPQGLALEQHFEIGADQEQKSDYSHWLEYGPQPNLIPRLWNYSMNAMAGLLQYGMQQSNDRLLLSPPIIPTPHRADARSVSLASQYPRYANNVGIPATYVGWTPNNTRGNA